MATAAVSAKDELSCPICFELFVDPHTPKNLPSCGHVLCEVCLTKMVAGQQTCPECRKEIPIPEDGITSFTTNYRLRTLAENHQDVDPKKAGVPLCPDHEDEKMHYYCVTCNGLACQACLTLKHNGAGHKIDDVKEIYRKQKDVMSSAIIMAKSRIDEVDSILCELNTAEIENTEIYKNITEVCENVDQQIEKYIQNRINELLADSQELKKQLEQVKQKHIADLKRFKREPSTVQKCIDSANVAYEAALSASENLPDYEYITQHAILIDTMEEIQMSQAATLANKTKQDVVQFVPSLSHTIVGQVISAKPGKVRRIKKIQTLDGFTKATRVDCTPDGLLAATGFDGTKELSSKTVSTSKTEESSTGTDRMVVYHKVDGKYKKKLDISLLESKNQYECCGIAISPDGRFMVARVTCIEVYSPEGSHQHDIEIKESSRVNIHRLAVTSDGRILVGDYHRPVAVEISATGEVLKIIHTRIQPNQMILIHDTHIAISDFEAGKVIVIDIESGQETLSIDIAGVFGICYDEHNDCLLAARNAPGSMPGMIHVDTGVIEQYSYTTGKLIACLQQGLYHPKGMALTSEGHLFVINKRAVEIYEIY